MPESHLKFHSADDRRKILVVEDEAINRRLLAEMLGSAYDLTFAENGAQGQALIRDSFTTLSLVLLDLMLPDMHGMDILRWIKGNSHLAHIPVIVLTSDRESEVESLNEGAGDFIPKPYPMPKVVLARVNRAIELSEDRDIIRWTERDQLTDLYNRDYFFRYAAQFDAYHADLSMDAIVIDVNHFHLINERYGKHYGDDVLRRVAEKVHRTASALGGMACRREGDTFLLYCPHQEDYGALLEALSVEMEDGARNRVRLRMGVYANADKSIDIERRFDRAKLAADTVRSSFTKAVAVYDNALHESEIFAEQLLEGFHEAIEQRQFQVYYQPKFDIRPAEPILCSAEALVRWQHPELGMVSPGVFIPLFEGNGLISELDDYVWREVARQQREWKDRLGFTVPVSVNVSRVDMLDPSLVEHMEGLIRENDLGQRDMYLEITETAYTQDSRQIIATVNQLRGLGFVIEMDDFGSGYSSLNMLSSLPIDALKLDMMFIRSAFSERRNTRMLELVLDIAATLGVPTVAEGVETAEQMYTLKAMGCDIVQGYYFSRPLPAGEYEPFLLARRELREAETLPEQRVSGATRGRKLSASLTYDALHDPVTGLYNRQGFDMLFRDVGKDNIALLLVGVRGLDRLSSPEAEAAVRAVTGILRQNFRSVDLICRIADDEFSVIVTRVTGAMQDLVREKVGTVGQAVAREGLPVRIAVGVAFSDRPDPRGSLLQDAGRALDRLIARDAEGCEFF